jgi:hypothetical protein
MVYPKRDRHEMDGLVAEGSEDEIRRGVFGVATTILSIEIRLL